MPKIQRKCIDSLRYNEYYNMQETFDELYDKSIKGSKFDKLMDLVIDENNILLAYRNIKSNGGSNTPGTDGKSIKDIANMVGFKTVQHFGRIFKEITDTTPAEFRKSAVKNRKEDLNGKY